jgi:regulator of nucleoside diphosphate kinase
MSQNIEIHNQIVLTTGMFDLLKAQITRKKLNPENEQRITTELRNAKQVLRKDLPMGIVDVYKSVTVTDLETNDERTYHFVPQDVARRKHGTVSILSDLGLALLGHRKGAKINWTTTDGEKIYRIEKVSDLGG